MRWTARFALLMIALGGTQAGAQDNPLKFAIRLSPEAAARPVSGRLLVMMTNAPAKTEDIRAGFGGIEGAAVYTAAMEVTNWIPGRQVTLNPDTLAYPAPFSQAPKGAWQAMALLDVDHSFARSEEGPGDIKSAVLALQDVDPSKAGSISLTLTVVNPAESLQPPAGMKVARLQSRILSAFMGRPVTMEAGIALPPSAARNPGRKYPVVLHVPGFGTPPAQAMGLSPWTLQMVYRRGANGSEPEMVHVFLDPNTPLGHAAFANSVNNGPWGDALVREYIPYLEKRFPIIASPRARFLTGHSSGGWSALWLQVAYPDAFNGVWATGPDPVDFRAFCGVNLASSPPENFYRKPDQTTRNLVRMSGRPVMSMQDFCRYEQVAGDYGGQMASFDAVFSPRGEDGRPMRLFDRQTGAVDPAVARAWVKYDISRLLTTNWPRLAPKLKGKLHVICGAEDNFHLNEAVALLKETMRALHSDAVVEIVPGRDHMNLYSGGLYDRIIREMAERNGVPRH
ncbi:MAG TPA: alpha/beta hydrolase [Armatimonadota bacterium]|jgi:pimeloyl-ACP methyl ester carboxylesterase